MPKGIKGFQKGNTYGGTPNHTLVASKSRAYVIESVAKDLGPILLAQREAAKGMYVERKIGKKKVVVYRVAPELKAGEYLLNQLIGKPKETLEVDGGVVMNIDKAVIFQLENIYGQRQIQQGNGAYTGNGKG